MKITCNIQKLVEAVSNVQRAVSSKSCLTVLEGIFIKTEDNKIVLCGYDLEIGITTKIDAIVKAPGAVVLSAKIFSDIIKRMPSEEISINVDEKLITTIKSGASEFSIIGIRPEDYPERPLINSYSDITIDALILKSMVRQTIFAVAGTDEKPINTGTLFDINQNQINLVSVDGYRLAKRSEKVSCNEKISFVVPGKTLSEILKLLPDESKNVNISIGKKHIVFQIDTYSIISRLLEGDFLDYNSAIPSYKTTEIVMNTKDFIESVERVSLVITDRLKSPIRCIFSNGYTKISCITALGKANDEFQTEMTGDNVEIGFNNRYLLDALKNVESDKVRVQMNGPLSPLKILPLEGNAFVFLVLPVRLKNSEQ